MPAVCARNLGTATMDKTVARDCKIRGIGDLACLTRRRLTRCRPDIPGLYNPFAHGNCACNEYVAARGRVVGDVPRMTVEGRRLLHVELRKIARRTPRTVKMTVDSFLRRYGGRRKTRYQNAADSLKERGITEADSIVSSFVKAEKLDPTSKSNPDPRMIQCRNARYNIELGRHLRPIEHHIYRTKSALGMPQIGKGLNSVERAYWLEEKFSLFGNPVCYSLDASRFDQHVGLEMLTEEHLFYTAVDPDPYFAWLLDMQKKNRCYTQNGIKYETTGKRMSGDMNTASGNCLLMLAMTRGVCSTLGVLKYELFVDGDDTLLIIDKSEEFKLGNLAAAFLEFGHEIKLEGRAECLENVQWCQSRFVRTSPPRMVRDWRKVLSTATGGTKYWHYPSMQPDMYTTVGACFYAEMRGVPILSVYARKLLSAQGKIIKDFENSDYHQRALLEGMKGVPVSVESEITSESRVSFEVAYGLSVMEQIHIENLIENWELPYGEPTDLTDEILPGWVMDYDLRVEPCPF